MAYGVSTPGALPPSPCLWDLEPGAQHSGAGQDRTFAGRLPVLPPVSQPPVAPTVCRISQSWSSGPGQQFWARQGHCGREGGLQPPLSWGPPADPTHHLHLHSCCQTGTCRGLRGTARLRGPGAPPGQEERRRCPAQPQAQAPRVPVPHGCPRPGPD